MCPPSSSALDFLGTKLNSVITTALLMNYICIFITEYFPPVTQTVRVFRDLRLMVQMHATSIFRFHHLKFCTKISASLQCLEVLFKSLKCEFSL